MEMVDIRSESPLFRIASTSFTRIAILLGPDEWEKLRSMSVAGDITILSEVWPRGDRIATTFYILSTVDFHNANAFFHIHKFRLARQFQRRRTSEREMLRRAGFLSEPEPEHHLG